MASKSVPSTSSSLPTLRRSSQPNNPLSHKPVVGHPLLAASYRTSTDDLTIPSFDPGYLMQELDLDRLNEIHSWLWMVGRPMPPRALHHQILLGREIAITEQLDMHLVWTKGRMFIKPIPRFLLESGFFEKQMPCLAGCGCSLAANPPSECKKQKIRKSALGFLFSYAALISHESDFLIAIEKYLLPSELTWSDWKKLVEQTLSYGGDNIYQNINKRFIYGELRLSRLNKIYQVTRGRSYMTRWDRYGDFFEANLAWLAASVAYIAIILTAMQVGLATEALGENEAFVSASYGFTIFSILGPLVVIFLILLAFCFAFAANWIATKKYERERFHAIGEM